MGTKNETIRKKEPIDILKPLVEGLGYKVEKKKSSIERLPPKNMIELSAMSEEELKNKAIAIDEEVKALEKEISDIRGKLFEHFKKEGPTEFTRTLFSGTAVPFNRINIFSDEHYELKVQKDYIVSLLNEKRKSKLISIFAEDKVKSLAIEQGAMGPVLNLRV